MATTVGVAAAHQLTFLACPGNAAGVAAKDTAYGLSCSTKLVAKPTTTIDTSNLYCCPGVSPVSSFRIVPLKLFAPMEPSRYFFAVFGNVPPSPALVQSASFTGVSGLATEAGATIR